MSLVLRSIAYTAILISSITACMETRKDRAALYFNNFKWQSLQLPRNEVVRHCASDMHTNALYAAVDVGTTHHELRMYYPDYTATYSQETYHAYTHSVIDDTTITQILPLAGNRIACVARGSSKTKRPSLLMIFNTVNGLHKERILTFLHNARFTADDTGINVFAAICTRPFGYQVFGIHAQEGTLFNVDPAYVTLLPDVSSMCALTGEGVYIGTKKESNKKKRILDLFLSKKVPGDLIERTDNLDTTVAEDPVTGAYICAASNGKLGVYEPSLAFKEQEGCDALIAMDVNAQGQIMAAYQSKNQKNHGSRFVVGTPLCDWHTMLTSTKKSLQLEDKPLCSEKIHVVVRLAMQ